MAMADQKKSEPNEGELDELEDEIEHARRDSEDVKHGSFYEGDVPMFPAEDEESTPEE